MAYSYNVYIDESGDDGLSKFRQPGGKGGASHWLVIGACIVRASRDLELVELRDKIRAECKPKSKRRDIHFKDMTHSQKRRSCQIIGGSPLRFSCVLGYKNTPEASTFTEKNQLYFYLTRFLIERVSWFCRDYRPIVKEGDGRAKIVFSRRGGLSYDGFKEYLERLKKDQNCRIHWPAIDISAVDAQDHSKLAALQIADFGVSAIASAIEPDLYGNVEDKYINEISKNIYQRHGNYMSYGLKFLPDIDSVSLSPSQKNVFKDFVNYNGQPPGP
ncbi:DUF3800 domain-containing protein [Paracoccaceae bacterium GXU_MW_L88]